MSARRRRVRHIVAEATAAFVLSAAALLTSWAGFQAALWDGEQAAAYARASAARVEAGALLTERGQAEGLDLFLFTQWLDAHARGDTRLQAFYRARFRPVFATAFDAWLAADPLHNPHAPPTPFAMRSYEPPHARQMRVTDRRADLLFAQGQRANAISDAYVQATVILALALFLGGIGQTFRNERLRLMLSAFALIACVAAFVKLCALPALSL